MATRLFTYELGFRIKPRGIKGNVSPSAWGVAEQTRELYSSKQAAKR